MCHGPEMISDMFSGYTHTSAVYTSTSDALIWHLYLRSIIKVFSAPDFPKGRENDHPVCKTPATFKGRNLSTLLLKVGFAEVKGDFKTFLLDFKQGTQDFPL